MFIPEVKFDLAPVDLEADLFRKFANPTGRWVHVFNRKYPELIPMVQAAKDQSEATQKCQEFTLKLHNEHENELRSAQAAMASGWSKVGPEFLKVLAEHLETTWPTGKPIITGLVTVFPVFPRFIDRYSFCLGYKNISDMIEVSAHEILHFLWFKKWQEVFPETKRNEYESPNLAWRLSEIMDPIILQCHPKIKELIKPKMWGYDSFKNIKIGEVGMTEYFKNIYSDSVAKGESFETFLKQAWQEAKNHEQEINNF